MVTDPAAINAIWERLEKAGYKTVPQIQKWLAEGKYDPRTGKVQADRNPGSYRNIAIELSEPFNIKTRIDDLTIDSDLGKINESIDGLDGERLSTAKKRLSRQIETAWQDVLTKELQKEPPILKQPLKELGPTEYKKYREVSKGGVELGEFGQLPQSIQREFNKEARRISKEYAGKSFSFAEIENQTGGYENLDPTIKSRISRGLRTEISRAPYVT